jgi:hypothetical protein
VGETPIDEGTTTLDMPGAPFNTMGTFEIQELNTPTRSASPCQPWLHVQSFKSILLHSPIPTSSGPLPHPPLFGQYTEPPMQADCFPRASGPSTGHSAHPTPNGGSASANVARTSPTGRFFACSDQIDALLDRGAWVHGAVINTLGDFFCYSSYSKPREKCFEILSTNLFHWWETGAQACQIDHSACFKGVASPLECHAWLVPILFKHHWYLLVVDWIDHKLWIHDSLVTLGIGPPSRLVEYGAVLMGYVNEDFGVACQGWPVIPDQVRHLRCILACN